MSKSNISFNQVTEQLLVDTARVYKDKEFLSDEILNALHFVFGSPLVHALDLIDRKCITMLTSPSGRNIFEIKGSFKTTYTCFSSSNYCSCHAYKFSVLRKEDYIMCKHVLAMKLSDIMNAHDTKEISDQLMAIKVSAIE